MNYQVGEHVNWVGTARLFCTEVVIARAGQINSELVPREITYDLADPRTGKILLFAATEREIEQAAPIPLASVPGTPCPSGYEGCDHDLTAHSADLGCWLCDCTYGRPS